MSLFSWIRKKENPLFVLPSDFKVDFQGLVKWDDLQPSAELISAVETKEEESVNYAFRCCQSLFEKGYTKLRRNAYQSAARCYIMAGCDYMIHIDCIARWKVGFEDGVARDVYNNSLANGIHIIPNAEWKELKGRLPPSAPCIKCGAILTKPSPYAPSGEWRCPTCQQPQNYAEQDLSRLIAVIVRSRCPEAVEKYKKLCRSVLTCYDSEDDRGALAPLVQRLISVKVSLGRDTPI